VINRRKGVAAVSAVGAAVLLAACSGGSSGGDAGASSGGGDQAAGAARGPITYVQGKDNSNVVRPTIDKWNAAHPNEKITFKEQSDQADQQHDDLVQHFQAKDTNYDAVNVDVVWTAEFAAKGWLQPLEGQYKLDTSQLLKPTVDSATFNGKLYAAPQSSDGGLLFYRKDLVPTAPKTWDEMISACSIAKKNNMDCYAGQFAQYEGLTVNVAEAINTAGGKIVGPDGAPTVDSPESVKGLARLADAYKNGDIPKQAITYQEEQGRMAFEAGKLLFLRNWAYVYGLATTDASSKVKGKFGVAPLPGDTASKPGASSLGGHNTAISVYSQHKQTVLDFIKFLETAETQKFFLNQGTLAPVIGSLYDDASLIKKFGYLPTLKTSISNAVPRPVTPFYPAVTKAIQQNGYSAIQGAKTPEQAIKDIQAAIAAQGS
jgi:multiple sugar transport system substrate-binding protein